MSIFGKRGKNVGDFDSPTGLFICDKSIFICDESNHRIIEIIDGQESNIVPILTELKYPSGICADDVSFYICDCDNHRIVIISRATGEVTFFGSEGYDEGKFRFPRGICFGKDSELLITDHFNDRVQIFDKSGNFIKVLAQLKRPYGISYSESDNTIFVAEHGAARVAILNINGQVTGYIGESILQTPIGVSIVGKVVFVADYSLSTVFLFHSDSKKMVSSFDKGASGETFNHPRGISSTSSGKVVVSDSFNHKIQVFQFPQYAVSLPTVPTIPAASVAPPVSLRPATETATSAPVVATSAPVVATAAPVACTAAHVAALPAPSAPVVAVDSASISTSTGTFYSYEILKTTLPPGVDHTMKEAFLDDSTFFQLFGKTKDVFGKEPKWKRDIKKKELGLF